MTPRRFNLAVAGVLSEAGWFAGRNVGDEVGRWLIRLCEHGHFRTFESAVSALTEFGRIVVEQRGPGIECAREPFRIDPLTGQGYEREFAEVGRVVGEVVFPLGDVLRGHAFLLIGKSGRIYSATDRIGVLGNSVDEALIRLIEGRWPLLTWNVDVMDGGQ